MAASMSRTSPGNYNVLLATLLCFAAAAAAFLPGSSASTPLVAQTCSRTSNPRVCLSLLENRNQGSGATTVRDLAIIALLGARNSALRAGMHAWEWELSHGERGKPTPTPAGRLVAKCATLYAHCLDAASRALSRVNNMPASAYDGRVADSVAALRVFPVKCQRHFDRRKIVSPLEKVNRDTEQKLGIASEIVRLMRPAR